MKTNRSDEKNEPVYRQCGHPVVVVLALVLLPLAASESAGKVSEECQLHPTHETLVPERGFFLVASPSLREPRFHHTVILLLAHGRDGTLGLIINKATEILLHRVLPELKIPDKDSRALFFGGPVGLDELIFLIRSANPPHKTTSVLTDVYFSNDRKLLEKLLRQNKRPNELRVYLGHSGWLPGQLASEIGRGDWQLIRADADTFFEKDLDTIWRDLVKHPSTQILARVSSPGKPF